MQEPIPPWEIKVESNKIFENQIVKLEIPNTSYIKVKIFTWNHETKVMTIQCLRDVIVVLVVNELHVIVVMDWLQYVQEIDLR